MLSFGIIVLAVGVLLLIISILLCFGFLNLLHEYHRNHVKEEDKKKFALSMGLSLLISALGMIASGITAIIVNNDSIELVTMLLVVVPLFVTIVFSLFFVKKYNGQIFG